VKYEDVSLSLFIMLRKKLLCIRYVGTFNGSMTEGKHNRH
jgi:hypothetical protein